MEILRFNRLSTAKRPARSHGIPRMISGGSSPILGKSLYGHCMQITTIYGVQMFWFKTRAGRHPIISGETRPSMFLSAKFIEATC